MTRIPYGPEDDESPPRTRRRSHHIAEVIHDRHLARDLGLEHLHRRRAPSTPWILPF